MKDLNLALVDMLKSLPGHTFVLTSVLLRRYQKELQKDVLLVFMLKSKNEVRQ